jgi:hypothetical protein
MIQRLQTVWLLFAAACAFATLKFSVYSGLKANEATLHYLNGTENLGIISVTLTIGIIALIDIFLYNERKLQLRLAILAVLLECLLVFLYYRQIQLFVGAGAYSLSAVLHIGIFIFLILAARGISKDEKLIKDSNRLR